MPPPMSSSATATPTPATPPPPSTWTGTPASATCWPRTGALPGCSARRTCPATTSGTWSRSASRSAADPRSGH